MRRSCNIWSGRHESGPCIYREDLPALAVSEYSPG
jgi:hypothetical protein